MFLLKKESETCDCDMTLLDGNGNEHYTEFVKTTSKPGKSSEFALNREHEI